MSKNSEFGKFRDLSTPEHIRASINGTSWSLQDHSFIMSVQ